MRCVCARPYSKCSISVAIFVSETCDSQAYIHLKSAKSSLTFHECIDPLQAIAWYFCRQDCHGVVERGNCLINKSAVGGCSCT